MVSFFLGKYRLSGICNFYGYNLHIFRVSFHMFNTPSVSCYKMFWFVLNQTSLS